MNTLSLRFHGNTRNLLARWLMRLGWFEHRGQGQLATVSLPTSYGGDGRVHDRIML